MDTQYREYFAFLESPGGKASRGSINRRGQLAVGEGTPGRAVDQGRLVGQSIGVAQHMFSERVVGNCDVGIRALENHRVSPWGCAVLGCPQQTMNVVFPQATNPRRRQDKSRQASRRPTIRPWSPSPCWVRVARGVATDRRSRFAGRQACSASPDEPFRRPHSSSWTPRTGGRIR